MAPRLPFLLLLQTGPGLAQVAGNYWPPSTLLLSSIGGNGGGNKRQQLTLEHIQFLLT